MKKMKIKGNDYVMVHERVMEFHKRYPNGSITTELVEMTDRFIRISKAIPDVKEPERYFTGIACEISNDESALENCETSSVGRCLGLLNIGIDTSIASYEEVDNAINKQKSATPKTKYTMKVDDKLNVNVKAVEKHFGKENLAEVKNLISFGTKHNGKEWKDVPDDYVNWCSGKDGGGGSSVPWQKQAGLDEWNKRNGNVPDRPNRASGGRSEVALEEVDEFEGMPS